MSIESAATSVWQYVQARKWYQKPLRVPPSLSPPSSWTVLQTFPREEDVATEEPRAGVHSYRLAFSRRLVVVVVPALVIVAVTTQFGWAILTYVPFLFGLAALGGFALHILTYRGILSNDAITVGSCFGRRRLERAAIAWQWLRPFVPFVWSSFVMLASKDRDAKLLKVRLPLKTDEAFDQWLATIPNRDQWLQSRARVNRPSGAFRKYGD